MREFTNTLASRALNLNVVLPISACILDTEQAIGKISLDTVESQIDLVRISGARKVYGPKGRRDSVHRGYEGKIGTIGKRLTLRDKGKARSRMRAD